jgi:hypothetical protein
MRQWRHGSLLSSVWISFGVAEMSKAADFWTTEPLHGCTFFSSALLSDYNTCAEFSAVTGRNGCRKTKGPVAYPGDDIEMWLPDYYIEVTKHIGRSMFAESADGKALAGQLVLASRWWASSSGPISSFSSNGSMSSSGGDNFWHVRLLTVPYGSLVNNYPPLSASIGTGLPLCYGGISEFYPGQWNYNLADGPYAAAWSPVGIPACHTLAGATSFSLGADAANRLKQVTSSLGSIPSFPIDVTCAAPVGAKEALFKNAIPTSDALSPLSNPLRLCIGSWGNLLPRTGWILTEDLKLSALIAAYKFQSLVADLHLNPSIKPRSDDKWQIVYPIQSPSGCFRPGSLLQIPRSDDVATRSKDETETTGIRKHHTYVIAVWRRRQSCEEPLQAIGGWTASYNITFAKNKATCQAMGVL